LKVYFLRGAYYTEPPRQVKDKTTGLGLESQVLGSGLDLKGLVLGGVLLGERSHIPTCY